jgi:hypothetical protein
MPTSVVAMTRSAVEGGELAAAAAQAALTAHAAIEISRFTFSS